eukprot:gene34553-41837_t
MSSVLRQDRSRPFSTVLLNDYRPKWPYPDFNAAPSEPKPTLPVRTIPDEKLRFHMSVAMEKGTSIFYSHLQSHPGTLRVRLYVKIDDLGLSPEEKRVVIAMVGPRFNPGKKEIKLSADRFPNRIENKRYLTLQLENIVAEAKRLVREKDVIG